MPGLSQNHSYPDKGADDIISISTIIYLFIYLFIYLCKIDIVHEVHVKK